MTAEAGQPTCGRAAAPHTPAPPPRPKGRNRGHCIRETDVIRADTSSRRFSHLPQGLSSRISLSSSESSPLSRGDLRSPPADMALEDLEIGPSAAVQRGPAGRRGDFIAKRVRARSIASQSPIEHRLQNDTNDSIHGRRPTAGESADDFPPLSRSPRFVCLCAAEYCIRSISINALILNVT